MDEKKKFVKPELIKFDKPLDEVTMQGCGSNCIDVVQPPCTTCPG